MRLQANRGKLLGLEASRGIAAILVVFFHAAGIMGLEKYYGRVPAGGFFGFGYAGVDFFFVLSGFIILYVHFNDIGKKERIRSYLTKRFIRIYPLHWLVTLLFIAGLLVYPLREFPDADKVFRSLFLLPQDGYPLGVVAWTLIHEVMFYLLFSILIVNRGVGVAAFSLWASSVAVGAALMGEEAGYLQSFLFSLHNLEFLLGMGVALLVRRKTVRSGWMISGLSGVIIFSVSAWLNYDKAVDADILLVLYAVGSALMIYALVVGDQTGAMKQVHPWFVFLGSASYSIYLIHFFALSVYIKVFLRLGADHLLPLEINYLLLVAFAVVTGCVLHVIVEKPLLNWCRSKLLVSR